MKLIIEYNAKHGYAVPDGHTEYYVDTIIANFLKQEEDMVVSVATALFVDFFRVRLAGGAIKPDQIEFMFENKVLEHDRYGTLRHWPKGFCDIPIEPMEQLLTIQSKAWKAKKNKNA